MPWCLSIYVNVNLKHITFFYKKSVLDFKRLNEDTWQNSRFGQGSEILLWTQIVQPYKRTTAYYEKFLPPNM